MTGPTDDVADDADDFDVVVRLKELMADERLMLEWVRERYGDIRGEKAKSAAMNMLRSDLAGLCETLLALRKEDDQFLGNVRNGSSTWGPERG